jgi:cyclase
MARTRLIARLDIKGATLIKGTHLEGLRVVGNPRDFAQRYYDAGLDELIYMDAVASLYGRNHLADLVSWAAGHVFIPLTVGGGLRSVDDVTALLRAGADKVAINTAAVARPALLTEVARRFGSQCMVLSIEAKRLDDGRWEAYTDNGRERSGLDVVEWATRGAELGAGEILLTSIDQEGTRRGLDIPLTRAVADAVNVPVIASGGMGTVDHLVSAVRDGHADAVAMADVLHYDRLPFPAIRRAALDAGLSIRHL